ncbi:MAG: ATP-binding protein [Thermoanaerobaculia bacterium]|nr:ATP-binding protein [Thermoanaerobaculia bacterium]
MSERRGRSFEGRLRVLGLAATGPLAIVILLLLARGGWDRWEVVLAVAAVGGAIAGPLWLGARVAYTLRTISNLLGGLREGDYSLRARGLATRGALAGIVREINDLGDVLRHQRLGALEATAQAHRVIDALDAAVFAFDGETRLRLANRAGARLLGEPEAELLGRSGQELGLGDFLEGEPARLAERSFPGRTGRWDVRRSGFRRDGLPLVLVVLSDVSRPLREEERQAWKRLLRVLGHELGNSLAPIRSLAETLGRLFERDPRPADFDDDARRGLALIAERSEALSRFVGAYSRLARLPPPRRGPVDLGTLVRRAAALEQRVPVVVEPGPPLTARVDADQLEQALINLIQNAAEASLAGGGRGVRITWCLPAGGGFELQIEDDGPGLANPDNLFVPFYTTKPQGSGIGLVLAREISEAHGGGLELADRPEGGCRATVRLPGG